MHVFSCTLFLSSYSETRGYQQPEGSTSLRVAEVDGIMVEASRDKEGRALSDSDEDAAWCENMFFCMAAPRLLRN